MSGKSVIAIVLGAVLALALIVPRLRHGDPSEPPRAAPAPPPPSPARVQAATSHAATLNRKLHLSGTVVAPNRNPVPSAKITVQITKAAHDGAGGVELQTETMEIRSDDAGRFRAEQDGAVRLAIVGVALDGWKDSDLRPTQDASRSVEDALLCLVPAGTPDAKPPLPLKMETALVWNGPGLEVALPGAPAAKLTISATKSPATSPGRFPWSLRITAAGVAVQDVPGNPAFAPADGYSATWTRSFQPGTPGWLDAFSQHLALKLPDGRFGIISLRATTAGEEKAPSILIEGGINQNQDRLVIIPKLASEKTAPARQAAGSVLSAMAPDAAAVRELVRSTQAGRSHVVQPRMETAKISPTATPFRLLFQLSSGASEVTAFAGSGDDFAQSLSATLDGKPVSQKTRIEQGSTARFRIATPSRDAAEVEWMPGGANLVRIKAPADVLVQMEESDNADGGWLPSALKQEGEWITLLKARFPKSYYRLIFRSKQ